MSLFRKRNSFGTQIVEVGLIVKERIGEVYQPRKNPWTVPEFFQDWHEEKLAKAGVAPADAE